MTGILVIGAMTFLSCFMLPCLGLTVPDAELDDVVTTVRVGVWVYLLEHPLAHARVVRVMLLSSLLEDLVGGLFL